MVSMGQRPFQVTRSCTGCCCSYWYYTLSPTPMYIEFHGGYYYVLHVICVKSKSIQVFFRFVFQLNLCMHHTHIKSAPHFDYVLNIALIYWLYLTMSPQQDCECKCGDSCTIAYHNSRFSMSRRLFDQSLKRPNRLS